MVYSRRTQVKTKGFSHLVNLSDFIEKTIEESGVKNGIACVFVPGSTAGVTTIEYEPGLIQDFSSAVERLFPSGMAYAHDQRWGDGNGFSHIRASFLGASLCFPISDGKPLFGTWQQVVLADFDNRPRNREVVMQIVGE